MKTKETIQQDWVIDSKHNTGLHKPTGISLSPYRWADDKIRSVAIEYPKQISPEKLTEEFIRILKEELEILLKDAPLITFQDMLEEMNIPPEKWEEGILLYKKQEGKYHGRELILPSEVLIWLMKNRIK